MCLIMIKPKGVALPERKYLEEGYRINKDAMGVMAVGEGKEGPVVHGRKLFANFDEFWEYVSAIPIAKAIITHFRYATHGAKDYTAAHPFPVTRDVNQLRAAEWEHRMGVVHNGVLVGYGRSTRYSSGYSSGHYDRKLLKWIDDDPKDKEPPLSDTQEFILKVLAEPIVSKNIGGKSATRLIQHLVGTSKFAILDAEENVYTFGEYYKDMDVWWSNKSYTLPVTRTVATHFPANWTRANGGDNGEANPSSASLGPSGGCSRGRGHDELDDYGYGLQGGDGSLEGWMYYDTRGWVYTGDKYKDKDKENGKSNADATGGESNAVGGNGGGNKSLVVYGQRGVLVPLTYSQKLPPTFKYHGIGRGIQQTYDHETKQHFCKETNRLLEWCKNGAFWYYQDADIVPVAYGKTSGQVFDQFGLPVRFDRKEKTWEYGWGSTYDKDVISNAMEVCLTAEVEVEELERKAKEEDARRRMR
jgi:hypothetical protein